MGLSRENSRQIGLLSRSGSREREELRKYERPSRLLGLILKTRSRSTSTTVTHDCKKARDMLAFHREISAQRSLVRQLVALSEEARQLSYAPMS